MTEAEILHVLPPVGATGVCADFDEDCSAVKEKARCFLSDTTTGICPFLD